MKLLFDQNISHRILQKIQHLFPKARQVRDLNLENAQDIEIWNYAKEHDYIIVTFDNDFYNYSNLFGHPPKIICLRIGNTSTTQLAQFLEEKYHIIELFANDQTYTDLACLEFD